LSSKLQVLFTLQEEQKFFSEEWSAGGGSVVGGGGKGGSDDKSETYTETLLLSCGTAHYRAAITSVWQLGVSFC
jgi:hypothetical protein